MLARAGSRNAHQSPSSYLATWEATLAARAEEYDAIHQATLFTGEESDESGAGVPILTPTTSGNTRRTCWSTRLSEVASSVPGLCSQRRGLFRGDKMTNTRNRTPCPSLASLRTYRHTQSMIG